jgi:hypothetical protein
MPHNCNKLIFDKGTKNIWWRKDSLFNKNCWENWLPVCKKLKLDPCLSPYTNINSIGSRILISDPKLKLIQERVGNTLELIGIGKNFLNGTPAAQQLYYFRILWYKNLITGAVNLHSCDNDIKAWCCWSSGCGLQYFHLEKEDFTVNDR